jgi:hypothetical protein
MFANRTDHQIRDGQRLSSNRIFPGDIGQHLARGVEDAVLRLHRPEHFKFLCWH